LARSGLAGLRSARDPTLHCARVKVKVAVFGRIGRGRTLAEPCADRLLVEDPAVRLDRPWSRWSIGSRLCNDSPAGRRWP